ncbi:MAG: hypothetical protein LBD02_10760 [Christensenellaceae bacterium]|jgi:hypothetical protein|nr:hypothetical protein [Christensenellaceae bacterium]
MQNPIDDLRIKELDYTGKDVGSAPDTLRGTPAENKFIFDRFVKLVLSRRFNALLGLLGGADAAKNISIDPSEFSDMGIPWLPENVGDAFRWSREYMQQTAVDLTTESGDMKKPVYDPQHRQTDIFGYVDMVKALAAGAFHSGQFTNQQIDAAVAAVLSGYIPNEALNMTLASVILPADGWTMGEDANSSQTVELEGVLSEGQTVLPSPASRADSDAWAKRGVRLESIAPGALIFTAFDAPTVDIAVSVALITILEATDPGNAPEMPEIHLPYIGESGNWMVWDAAAVDYVDSGVTAYGSAGASAYDMAVEAGYTGTEEEYAQALASLGNIGVAMQNAVNLHDQSPLSHGDIRALVNALDKGLAAEVARAQDAEQATTQALAEEITRAEQAEQGLSTAIGAEATRAQAAEGANAQAITAEAARAQTAEAAALPKMSVYNDGSYEQWAQAEFGGGHSYYDAPSDTIITQKATNDPLTPVVLEVSAVNQTSGVGARILIARDENDVLRQYYTVGQTDESFAASNEQATKGDLAAAQAATLAAAKAYADQIVSGMQPSEPGEGTGGAGLKIPVSLAAESDLDTAFPSPAPGDYAFIQNMDVTAPGHTGRAWYAGDAWNRIYDEYFAPDGTTTGMNASGQIETRKVPFALSFTGGATGSYDGSGALGVAIPTTLKNPAALSFTGGATGSYDGSATKTVAIPSQPSDVGAAPALHASQHGLGGNDALQAAQVPYANATLAPGVTSVAAGIDKALSDANAASEAVAGLAGAGFALSRTAILTAAGWSDGAQTVSVAGVAATGQNIAVAPAGKADMEAWAASGLWCTGAGQGTITFTCDEAPTLDVNVAIAITINAK